MSSLRLQRFAHTPAKGDRRNVGTKPQMMVIVAYKPDCVVRVTCRVIAQHRGGTEQGHRLVSRKHGDVLFRLSFIVVL